MTTPAITPKSNNPNSVPKKKLNTNTGMAETAARRILPSNGRDTFENNVAIYENNARI